MKSLDLVELRNGLKRLTLNNLQDATAKIIVEDSTLLSRKRDEFKAGVKPDGSIIGTYKSDSYKLFKIQKNPSAGGNVDLILTGSTARQLGVDSLGNGVFKIKSNDPKWNSLISKYGSEIQSINKDVFDGLQKSKYAPQLIEKMRSISKL